MPILSTTYYYSTTQSAAIVYVKYQKKNSFPQFTKLINSITIHPIAQRETSVSSDFSLSYPMCIISQVTQLNLEIYFEPHFLIIPIALLQNLIISNLDYYDFEVFQSLLVLRYKPHKVIQLLKNLQCTLLSIVKY